MLAPIFFCHAQQNISQADVSDAARNWLSVNKSGESNEIRQINSMTNPTGDTLLYEVIFDSTTILLSGHRNCIPILATYQSCGMSVLDTTNHNLPCGMSVLISDFVLQVKLCIEEYRNQSVYDSIWTSLICGNLVRTSRSYVEPLVKTRWSQGYSNTGNDYPAYNYYCVSDSECSYYPVGCGAVALGQVMNYWNYPILLNNQPEQTDWCNMTNSLDYNSMPNYEKCRNAIAGFLYNCARDIHTSFGCSSSISSMDNIYEALVEKYGYNAYSPVRRSGSDNDWIGRIKMDIDNGYPVIYRGADSNNNHGHFFILDGYDSDGRFHINWGWGNSFLNFYAYLNGFAPGSNDYRYYQWAIFKISAPYFGEYCHQSLSLGDFYHDNASLLHDYHPYEIVPQTMTTLTSASATSDASWRTIPTGATAVYQAHKEIILQDGFEAQLGCEFEARIEPCEQCEELRDDELSENHGYTASESNNDNDNGDDERYYSTGTPTHIVDPDLFPNPTDGPLTMYTKGQPQQVFIYTLDGRLVGGWHLTALGDNFVTLDVSTLRSGTYLLSVTGPSEIHTARFIRR